MEALPAKTLKMCPVHYFSESYRTRARPKRRAEPKDEAAVESGKEAGARGHQWGCRRGHAAKQERLPVCQKVRRN